MTLNHLNLTVTDVVTTQEFLVKYFGLKARGKPNSHIAILADDQDMVLTLMSASMSGDTTVQYPPSFHIGFIQDDARAVNALHERLRADGIDAPAPSRQHGSWTFYFDAPGGFTIEVMAHGSAPSES